MNASLLSVLSDAERLVVAETESAALASLDENAAIDLETRIRRARNKYVGQYRRRASARVPEKGGRARGSLENEQAAMKAEAFEEALARVTRRVSMLARQAAAELRAHRISRAKAAKGAGPDPGSDSGVPKKSRKGPAVTGEPLGDRALRSPASEKRRASTRAMGARRQTRRDAKRARAR